MKVRAPLKSKKTQAGYEFVDLDVVCPFGLVSYLWNDIGIDISRDDVVTYWRHHRAHGAKWALHSRAPEDTMPLALYGDAVKVRSTYLGLEKMVGIFLSAPLYRPRSARCSRWLLCAVQEELLWKHHTLDSIFTYLTWAMNQLYTGCYPQCGPRGECLTGRAASRAGGWVTNQRWRFQITELRGDWLWHKTIFRFRSSWKAGTNAPVCFKCEAYATGSPDHTYYNIEENSPVWATEYQSVVDFIVGQCPDVPCPLAIN